MGNRGKGGATVAATVAGSAWRKNRGPKPAKPYPEFPLFAHAAGVWAKVIRSRTVYFGPWRDPAAALDHYLKIRHHLHAGLPPPAESITLLELADRFLVRQRDRCRLGEISGWHFADCLRDGRRLVDCLGRTREVRTLEPADFARLRAATFTGRNATTVSGILVRMRAIFTWGVEARLLNAKPNYGGQFSLPSALLKRRALRAAGPRDLSARDIKKLLRAAGRPGLINLRAMILLGINCGLGNSDCSELRESHLDLSVGLLTFPRPKTEADRRAILWPVTVVAIRAAVAHRFTPLADRVFVTRAGHPYVHASPAGKLVNVVSLECRRLLIECGIHRKGLGFYALRHTFRTVADATGDWPAIDLVMGHTADDMGSRYRERIGDDRLRAISEYVRTWLFGKV